MRETTQPKKALERKLVVVGDASTNKTGLLIGYLTNNFPEEYTPTVFDNHGVDLQIDGRPIRLSMWDTKGQEDYDRMRPLSYPGTDVFLLLYSIDSPTSFHNIRTQWFPEISHHAPHAKIVLVGHKLDKRNDVETIAGLAERGLAPITREQGEALAQQIRAVGFVECSSETQEGVKEVFEQAARATVQPIRLAIPEVREILSHGQKADPNAFSLLLDLPTDIKRRIAEFVVSTPLTDAQKALLFDAFEPAAPAYNKPGKRTFVDLVQPQNAQQDTFVNILLDRRSQQSVPSAHTLRNDNGNQVASQMNQKLRAILDAGRTSPLQQAESLSVQEGLEYV